MVKHVAKSEGYRWWNKSSQLNAQLHLGRAAELVEVGGGSAVEVEMKCMGIPADLSFDVWFALVRQQCMELGVEADKDEWWRLCFDDGLTVNEAVAIYIR